MVDLSGLMEGAAGGAVVAIVIKGIDEFSNTFDKAKEKVSGLSFAKVAGTAALVGTAAVGVGKALIDVTKEFDTAADVSDAFYNKLGKDGNDVLEETQKSVLGTVDKYELMSSILKTTSRGISTDSIPQLALLAQQLKDSGQATGSVTDIMDEFSGSLATGRTAALKHYGVMVDSEKAIQSYASSVGKTKDTLTDFEKQQALISSAMQEIQRVSSTLPKPIADATDMVEQMSTTFKELKVDIGEVVSPLLKETFDALKPIFKDVGGIIKTDLLPIIKELAPILMDILRPALDAISIALQILKPVLEPVAYVFKVLEPVIRAITWPLQLILDIFRELLLPLREAFMNSKFFKDVIEALKGIIEAIIYPFKAFSDALRDSGGIVQTLGMIWQSFKDSVSYIWEFLKGAWESFKTAMGSGLQFIQELWQGFKDYVETTWYAFKDTIAGIWNFIVEGWKSFKYGVTAGIDEIKNIWNSFKSNVSDTWSNIKTFLANTWEEIKNKWENFKKAAASGLDKLKGDWENLGQKGKSVFELIRDKVSDALTKFNEFVSNAVSGASKFVNDVCKRIVDSIKSIPSAFGDVVSSAYGWGRDLLSNFISGITRAASNVKSSVASTAKKLLGSWSFDNKANDMMAQRWGSDFLKNFTIGMNDIDISKMIPELTIPSISNIQATPSSSGQINNINISVNATVSNDSDINVLADKIGRVVYEKMVRR